ncbi:MAG: hypothetical protein IPM35_18320 [Myxococcales bacterium]|nr:hypothetical protein [Myxococcales bacterium]
MSATLAELRDLRADLEAAQRSLLLTSESVLVAGEDFAEARTTFGQAQLGHVRADLLEHLVVLMRAARTLERVERELPALPPRADAVFTRSGSRKRGARG